VTLPRAVRLFCLLAILGLCIAIAADTRPLADAEQRALDGLFVMRYKLHGTAFIDPRIVVIHLDNRASWLLRKPLMFSQPELARLAQALHRAGAKAVALDFIPDPPIIENLPPAAIDALEAGELQLRSTILDSPLVLMSSGSEQPTSLLQSAAERAGHLGAVNLLSDTDGTVRRLPLFVRQGKAATFAEVVAELGAPQSTAQVVTEDHGRALRVNYPGPAGSFRQMTFSQLWPRVERNDALPELAGSICLIGQDDAVDLVSTPYATFGSTPGVEVHAAALNTLLTRHFIVPSSTGLRNSIIIAAALVCGGTAACCPVGLGLFAALALVVVYLAVCTEAFTAWGVWLPITAPLLAAATAFLAGYGERYLAVEKGRTFLRGLFGRYVSPQVVSTLLRNPETLSLGGARRRVTVLFSDINDFTSTSEKNSPETIISMLNTYYEEMVAIVDRYQGTVTQYVGDEIMVVYGAPQDQPDHAARAVRTALDMIDRLDEMARANPSGAAFCRAKIGVHTGDVVAGNIGSAERCGWTVVGDDVNLTARIESEAKRSSRGLLVSEVSKSEAEASLPDVEWSFYGSPAFKGKTQSMGCWEPHRKDSTAVKAPRP
jgi:adenylate cyclase